MKSYGKVTLVLVAAWFVFALSASALSLFRNDAERVGLAIALAAGIPVIIFFAWFGVSQKFRQFTQSLDPRILTLLQSGRILGFIFVLLQAHALLPAIFAWPAGYGDMAVGFTATFAAWKLADARHRSFFIFWQALGMADLIVAVGMGTAARLLVPHGTSMLPMTILPLSLVPTFLVPLYFIFHMICIAQARTWKGVRGFSAQAANIAFTY
jgi:hypothetical protein